MAQRDNILQELKELQSSLANAGSQNIYQVPPGYFDDLADQVLSRIKALDAVSAAEEVNHLSPLVSGISRQMPFSVPVGFFDQLAENVVETVVGADKSAAEELQELSPLLSGLKKEMPFSIPAGYFDNLSSPHVKVEPAKVVPFTKQNWFRYAAAAAVFAFVATVGFILFNNKASIDPKTQPAEWVMKNTRKINPDDINKFVQLVDEASRDLATVNDVRSQVRDEVEISDLIKDIPDQDIQSFLDETLDEGGTDGEDVFMN